MHQRMPLILGAVLLANVCGPAFRPSKNIEAEYDSRTGRLNLLRYASKADGKVDTWSYMDGAHIRRIEIDKDGDGKIDRWEYYDSEGKLEKVGFSRVNDGRLDGWAYPAPDGSIARIDTIGPAGNVTRSERYENRSLVQAEEDVDGDGKTDRWETYDGDRLAMLALDTRRAGRPDRRIVYGADGNVRIEVDPRGTGDFMMPDERRAKPRQKRP